MYEKFTDRARKVMQLANQEAQRFNHDTVGVGHVLIALIKEGGGVGANVLKSMGIADAMIKATRDALVPGGDIVTLGKLPYTPGAAWVIDRTVQRASDLKHDYIDTGHMLLALMDYTEGIPCGVAIHVGSTPKAIQDRVLEMIKNDMTPDKPRNVSSAIPVNAIGPILLEIGEGKWVRFIDGRLLVRPGEMLS